MQWRSVGIRERRKIPEKKKNVEKIFEKNGQKFTRTGKKIREIIRTKHGQRMAEN